MPEPLHQVASRRLLYPDNLSSTAYKQSSLAGWKFQRKMKRYLLPVNQTEWTLAVIFMQDNSFHEWELKEWKNIKFNEILNFLKLQIW